MPCRPFFVGDDVAPDHIVPSVFDKRVGGHVAEAVAAAARPTGWPGCKRCSGVLRAAPGKRGLLSRDAARLHRLPLLRAQGVHQIGGQSQRISDEQVLADRSVSGHGAAGCLRAGVGVAGGCAALPSTTSGTRPLRSNAACTLGWASSETATVSEIGLNLAAFTEHAVTRSTGSLTTTTVGAEISRILPARPAASRTSH